MSMAKTSRSSLSLHNSQGLVLKVLAGIGVRRAEEGLPHEVGYAMVDSDSSNRTISDYGMVMIYLRVYGFSQIGIVMIFWKAMFWVKFVVECFCESLTPLSFRKS